MAFPPAAYPQPLIPANVNAGYHFMPSDKVTLPALELDLSIEQMKCLTQEIRAFLQQPPEGPEGPRRPPRSLGGGRFAPLPREELLPVVPNKWQAVYHTDGAAHAGEAVHAILCVDDGAAPTLYSTSPGFLNSWRCMPGPKAGKGRKGRPEPLLALDRAQKNTGYHIFSICYVPLSKLLVGAGIETVSQSPALLSISADPVNNYLGPKDVRAPPALTMKVEALHAIPPLSGCVAASGNGSVTIFDLSCGDFSVQKTAWVAHSDFLTCLRAVPPQPHLLTGSQAGDIHYWDLRGPALSPTVVLRYHTRAVTDLQPTLGAPRLFSGAADGSVLEWDLRKPQVPVAMMIPDLRSVLALRLHPAQPHLLAVATLRGLHCLDLRDRSLMNVSPLEEKITYPAVDWNAQSGLLYACKLNGELEAWQMTTTA